ncbi:hypothetical protein [Chengkuizengella sediminis]|uniref:hypothetical protein n=1 Tax=Chengkuizengella sediminis TaxID=1885917 RepID=UPI00138A625F|nr:hypothetical protein [Chengkuizengella sediminis]NDI35594.1 hypothetical protein [Chengkuizengella sediminis]
MDNLFLKNQINQAKKMLEQQISRIQGSNGGSSQIKLQEDYFKSLQEVMNQRLNQVKQFQGNDQINGKIDQNRVVLEKQMKKMNDILSNLEGEDNKLDALHKKMNNLMNSFLEKKK